MISYLRTFKHEVKKIYRHKEFPPKKTNATARTSPTMTFINKQPIYLYNNFSKNLSPTLPSRTSPGSLAGRHPSLSPQPRNN